MVIKQATLKYSASFLHFFQASKINQAACDLAKGVAQEGGVLFAGSICQTASLYSSGAGKKAVMEKFRHQMEIFVEKDVDLIIAEVSHYTEITVLKNKLVHENAVTYSGLWTLVIFIYSSSQ